MKLFQSNLNFNNLYFSIKTKEKIKILEESFYKEFNNLTMNKIEWSFIVKQIKSNGESNVKD